MKDGEGINQRTFVHNPWAWTIIWRLAWGGEKGGKSGWRWEKGEKVRTTVTDK